MIMKTQCSKKGFTLAEVLITIALLGILAAMVLPRLTGQTDKARAAEAINMLGAIRQAEISYRNGPAGEYLGILNTTDGGWSCADPALWARLGIGDPNGNPNSLFGYCIDWTDDPTSGPVIFRAVARRLSAANADDEVITLNQDGIWDGNSPHVPQNEGGADCESNWFPCWP